MTVTGLLVWSGGTMSGAGTTTVDGPLVMGAADSSNHSEILDQRTLNIAGPASYAGASTFATANGGLVHKNPADIAFSAPLAPGSSVTYQDAIINGVPVITKTYYPDNTLASVQSTAPTKTITWTYNDDAANGPTVGSLASISEQDTNPDGSTSNFEWDYTNGSLASVSEDNTGAFDSSSFTWSYNAQGALLSASQQDTYSDGSSDSFAWTYNGNPTPLSVTQTTTNTNGTTTNQWTNNADGTPALITQKATNPGGSLASTATWTFSNGLLNSVTQHVNNSDGTSTDYAWDNNADGSLLVYNWTNDANGNPVVGTGTPSIDEKVYNAAGFQTNSYEWFFNADGSYSVRTFAFNLDGSYESYTWTYWPSFALASFDEASYDANSTVLTEQQWSYFPDGSLQDWNNYALGVTTQDWQYTPNNIVLGYNLVVTESTPSSSTEWLYLDASLVEYKGPEGNWSSANGWTSGQKPSAPPPAGADFAPAPLPGLTPLAAPSVGKTAATSPPTVNHTPDLAPPSAPEAGPAPVAPVLPDQLVVTIQPLPKVINGQKFDVQITAEDVGGNVDPNFKQDVTISLAKDPNGNSNLGGTLIVAAQAGVADFSDLTLDKAGQGFTLQATSATSFSVTTNPFDVTIAKIIFYADGFHPTEPTIGHAFVQLFTTAGPQAGEKDLVYGLEPDGWNVFSTKGLIDWNANHPWDWRIVFAVTADQYNAVRTFIENPIPPDYHLLTTNCTWWIEQVANVAGLPLPGLTDFLGVADPSTFRNSLAQIGNGGIFKGGTVQENTMGTLPTGAPDPPPPYPDQGSVDGLSQAALLDPANLAQYLNLAFQQETLNPVNVGVGQSLTVNLGNLDLNNALLLVDFGDGTVDEQSQGAAESYQSSGTFQARVIVINSGAVDEFSFEVDVGSGAGSGTVAIQVPNPPPNLPFPGRPSPPEAVPLSTTTVQLPAVLENAKTATGATISSLIQGHVSDPDPNAREGIAVIGLTGNGKWQFSTDGLTWVTIAKPSISHALLLPAADQLRYIPATNENGQFDLTFLAWDQIFGAVGKFVSIGALGGANSFSAQSGTMVAPVTHVNQAPTWTGTTAHLTPVLPGTYNLSGPDPTGDTVAGIFGGFFSDADGNSVGVAIVSAAGASNGTWQYSTDGGTNWTGFGAVGTIFGVPALSNALLLSAVDMLRFVPKTGFVGTTALGAYAWDRTNGSAAAAGATKGFSIAVRGGTTAFSKALLTARCAVNNAPTLGAASGPTLPTATEGVAKTVTVSTLLTGALKGIAIVGMGGSGEWPGNWQYSLDNLHWFSVPAVSESSAFLLPSTASLRFVAAVQANSSTLVNPATLTYRAWDQTAGASGKLFAVAGTGGATPISGSELTASMPVNFANHAPTWLASTFNLTPVLPRDSAPAGNQVADAATVFQDADGNPIGVAVVAATGTSNGAWEFSSDGGTSWNTPLFAPSSSNALLLPAGDRVRFRRKTGFAGVVTVSVYAWDGTKGSAALAAATKGFAIAARGGSTAFSTALLTVRCAVNNAPKLGAASGPTLPPVTEGVAKTITVSSLLTSGQVSDPNPGALKGIAIVGMDGSGEWPGTWQYSLDNLHWFSVPAVSESSAFLLSSTASLRFTAAIQPKNSSTASPATLAYCAWDQTAGTSGKLFAVAGTGGATPISMTELTASIPVNFVNHAPTWLTSAVNLTPELPGTTNPAGDTVAGAFGGSFNDVDGNSVGVAIVSATGTSNGTWEYSTDGGATWTSFGALGTIFGVPSLSNALLLSATDLIRFVPKTGFVGTATLGAYAWDGTQGTKAAVAGATKGIPITARGGATPFSTALLIATILVDTAPVLSA